MSARLVQVRPVVGVKGRAGGLLLLGLVAACANGDGGDGGGGGDGGDGGGDGVDAAAPFAPGWTAPVRCDFEALPIAPGADPLVRACTRLVMARGVWERACQGRWWVDPAATIDSCVGMLRAPGVTVTVADLERCNDWFCGLTCNRGDSCFGNEVQTMFRGRTGSLPPGSACLSPLQCESGYCRDNWLPRCGTCRVRRLEGEACGGPFDSCELGLDCEGGVCIVPGLREGEKCVHGHGPDQCRKALFCQVQGMRSGAGTCVRPLPLGARCYGTARECGPDAYCRSDACTPLLADGAPCPDPRDRCRNQCNVGVCGPAPPPPTPPPVRFGLLEGEACGPERVCLAELACEGGVCGKPSGRKLAAGSACTWPEREPECAAGLVCDRPCDGAVCDPKGTCVAPPVAGEPCLASFQCAAGFQCQGPFTPGRHGQCVPLGRAGEPCPCARDLVCQNERCVAISQALCGG